MSPNLYTFSDEISTGSEINEDLDNSVGISLGTPVGGLNSFIPIRQLYLRENLIHLVNILADPILFHTLGQAKITELLTNTIGTHGAQHKWFTARPVSARWAITS